MPVQSFHETGENSISGKFLYDQIIPQGHFYRELNELVPWKKFSDDLIECYEGQGVIGRDPYDPVLLLKMLFVAYLYDISEREAEFAVNYNLEAKYFLGLAVEEKGPDHSTLSVFRKRIIEHRGEDILEKLFTEILQAALKSGVEFGKLCIIDSTHTEANADPNRKKVRDPEAAWGYKHDYQVKDKNGNSKTQTEYFYGYKQHAAMDAQTQLITGLTHSSGERYDGHFLPELVNQHMTNLPLEIVTADKGYDDGENHYYLENLNLQSAIRLKRTRTKKRGCNKAKWLKLQQEDGYQSGLRQRWRIEPKFAEEKRHGLRRARYVGKANYKLQSYLTAMVVNLKRMVKLLFGVGLRGYALAPG